MSDPGPRLPQPTSFEVELQVPAASTSEEKREASLLSVTQHLMDARKRGRQSQGKHVRRSTYLAKTALGRLRLKTKAEATNQDLLGVGSEEDLAEVAEIIRIESGESDEAVTRIQTIHNVRTKANEVRKAGHGKDVEISAKYKLDEVNEAKIRKAKLAATLVRDALAARSTHHKTDEKSVKIWQFVRSGFWFRLRIIVAIIHMGLAMFERPTFPGWKAPFPTTQVFELVFLTLYAVDLYLLYASTGPDFGRETRRYWRIVFLVLALVDVLASLATSGDTFRFSRVLRPFFLIQFSSVLWNMVMLAVTSLWKALNVLSMVLFLIVFFSLFGFFLMKDIPGNTFFETVTQSMLSLFILLTTANFPDVMLPAYNENRWYCLFFIVYIVLGIYFLTNLMLATVYNSFSSYTAKDVVRKVNAVETALKRAFDTLSHKKGTGIANEDSIDCLDIVTWILLCREVRPDLPLEVNELLWNELDADGSGEMDEQEFFDLCRFLSATIKIADVEEERRLERHFYSYCPRYALFRERVKIVIETPVLMPQWLHRVVVEVNCFEAFFDALVILNAVVLFIQATDGSDSVLNVLNDVCLLLFIIEMTVKMIAHGPIGYWRDSLRRFDGIITVGSVVGEILLRDNASKVSALRILRILRLLGGVPSFRVILATLYNVMGFASIGLVGILLLLCYVYSIIGMELYAGRLNAEDFATHQTNSFNTAGYFAMNFNDLPTSLVTLFTLLLVNNWFIIMDGAVAVTTEWSRVFFISFYLFGVIIIFNLVVAFLLDSFIWFKQQDEERKQLLRERTASDVVVDDANPLQIQTRTNVLVGMYGGENAERFRGVSFD